MTKKIKNAGIMCALAFVLLLNACKNDDKTDTGDTTTAATTASSPTTATATKAATLSGLLDTLWVTAADFKNLDNKKLVFSFTFRDPDTLTLFGWSCKGVICNGSYNTDPDIKLIKGHQSAVNYGPKVIFGNVILQANEVSTIKKKIGTTYSYVVFVPVNDGEFIRYDIYVSNDDPSLIKVLVLDPTGVDANPSPPKTY